MMTLTYFFVVPKQTFRLKKLTKNATLTNQCLTVADEQNYNISGGNCSSSLNMHWIWTKKRIENQDKFYLMNVMTLQCLEFLTSTLVCASNDKYQIGEVALKQCNKIDGQYILVNSNIIKSELCSVRRNYYIRLENVQNDVGYPAFSQRNIVDRWTNNEDHLNLHKRPTKYTGQCSMFQYF
jgi:flagella basal body P-ring formation protein FlgA